MSTISQDLEKYIKEHFIKVILMVLFALSLGYVMLVKFSTWDSPFLGITFHIVMGCLLLVFGVIIGLVAIKIRFFQKKKRRSQKPIFLKKIN